MNIQDFKKQKLPDSPGVYLWKKDKEILYIGKATSLSDRVKSYFSNDLIATRGPLLVDMVSKANHIDFQVTDSVLEALILEASLIKKHIPYYNTKEKDDKSFNWVIITKEDFPRVLIVRGREIEKGLPYDIQEKYGPFTQSNSLKEALKIIRKLFPFRDKCLPCSENKNEQCRPCFNYQIGLCPGVCAGLISKKDYSQTIKHLKYFLSGKKETLIKELEKEMAILAKAKKFEEAEKIKRTFFALKHIQDVALIKKNDEADFDGQTQVFRIEAYDIAHHAGSAEIGVMVVNENSILNPQKYRLFNIKNSQRDDLAALKEVFSRRLNHSEWSFPNLIVVDGDQRQIKVFTDIIRERGLDIPVVSVVKDDKHKARAIIGTKVWSKKYSEQILKINTEAHRFAIQAHRRQLRKKFLD